MLPAPCAPFHTLYRDHHGWLVSWLRRRLGNEFDSADLAQDTFLKVLKAGTHEVIYQPRPFLATLARGLVCDFFRRKALEASYLEALAQLPAAHQPSLETQAVMREALFEIDALLQGMGGKVRETFLLAQFEGLSYVDIAARLGISLRTVNRHMARAMEHCCLALP